jgi:hypothetical protein
VIAGAVIGSLVLLISLIALAVRTRLRPRLSPPRNMVDIFPPHAHGATRQARKAVRDARPQQLATLLADEKLGSADAPGSESTAGRDTIARAPAREPGASIVHDVVAALELGADRRDGPQPAVAEGAARRIAALQGEIHRLRAERIGRDGSEDSERPPSYD